MVVFFDFVMVFIVFVVVVCVHFRYSSVSLGLLVLKEQQERNCVMKRLKKASSVLDRILNRDSGECNLHLLYMHTVYILFT